MAKRIQTSLEGSDEHDGGFLPIANVGRIMKKSIPSNGKISKEAKETVKECVSEFISFITGEASDKCRREKRKTINADDLLWAMTTLGFENYVDPLKIYLNKYLDNHHHHCHEKTTRQGHDDDLIIEELNSYSTGTIINYETFNTNGFHEDVNDPFGLGHDHLGDQGNPSTAPNW
ncbi:nuclear transcription factor Y subunit B-3-like [Impatiens glandulifera]|uniref:nuclear transcription factor Y subunit B-3-like n=1 Tax=Impatiens glandulifera TaxID=253017 RepID=UPI001FB194AE|nr:nuclear transcription factor Y subunit B-3-like [Impatiens glandulifera]